MLLPEAALALVLAWDTPPKVPPAAKSPAPTVIADSDPAVLATSIRKDLESIAGPGAVDVKFVSGRLFNVRIAVPSLRSDVCNPIYDRELKLYRLFPELNFDFYLRVKP